MPPLASMCRRPWPRDAVSRTAHVGTVGTKGLIRKKTWYWLENEKYTCELRSHESVTSTRIYIL